ncbi:MAG TPA: hypothetical protein VK013_09105 [Myxococcaceae bacterium]|nr:hypothetical protein [Myxococcaceae bacterium]
MARSPAPHPLVARLQGWGLLRAAPPVEGFAGSGWPIAGEAPAIALLKLAALGALEGGLSASQGVRADELIGPLCQAMGGAARELRVTDVREAGGLSLEVSWRGREARWSIPSLDALPVALNALLGAVEGVRPAAVLGHWEEALHLWCVPRALLDPLLDEALEGAWNLEQLEDLV